ncbi:MAG: SH3 domain-containing protein [Lachnospiraceae bacterium]|nr:SH3 domain-containing protein [Lachnospiraceae bacterium]
MKRRQRDRLILIIGLVVVIAIIVAVILLLVLTRKKLEYLTLTPTFQETELDVNSDYVFMVTTEPEDIRLKDLEYSVDDPTAVFTTASEDNTQAVLHTGAEGTLNIYVKQGDIVSNYMSFSVVDITARAQEEANREAEEAAAQEALEYEAAQAAAVVEEPKYYVQTIKDSVNVRSGASTDTSSLGKVPKGTKFEKLGEEGDWFQIEYNGQNGYIRSDMLEEISELQYQSSDTSETAEQTDNTADEKKKQEQQNTQADNSQAADNNNAQAAANTAADAAAQAAAAAQQAAEAAAAQQAAEAAAAQQALLEQQAAAAAAAAAQAAAGGRTINCTDGTMTVTAAQYQCLEGYWSYTGDTDGMISHHSKGEIQNLLSLNGL